LFSSLHFVHVKSVDVVDGIKTIASSGGGRQWLILTAASADSDVNLPTGDDAAAADQCRKLLTAL